VFVLTLGLSMISKVLSHEGGHVICPKGTNADTALATAAMFRLSFHGGWLKKLG
jgi:hypothetical protein